MSDPSAAFLVAMAGALPTDAGLLAAFGSQPPRFHDITPQNPPSGTGKPYIVYGQTAIAPDLAECFDSVQLDWTGHVWSLTSPPGTLQAKQIAAALLAFAAPTDAQGNHVPPTWSLAGFTIVTALPLGVDHLTNLADQSAHSIVRVRYAIDRA